MKFAKRSLSILLALLMLVSVMPITASAATLAITTQPETGYTAMGETAKATVEATGDGLTYQWYIKNVGQNKYSKSSITTATYSVTMSEKVDGRYAYCIVKDKYGNEVRSETVTLRLKLTIDTQPKTSYTAMGETAKATVTATGSDLTYQWYIKNVGQNKYSKSSITKATYSAKMSEKVDGRYAYCIVKDKYGNEVRSKTITLRLKLAIDAQPKTSYTAMGEIAKATVTATGSDLTYQWYIKNVSGSKYSKSSITEATYSAKMSDKVKDRLVYCVVTDKYGKEVRSETVRLHEAVSITTQPKSVRVDEGEKATVKVVASGDGLSYQWYVKNAGGSKYSKSSITKATYSVKMSDKVKDRLVYCVVTDKYGKEVRSETVSLRMNENPFVIVTQPEDVVASAGEEVSFTVELSGGKAPYGYHWELINDIEGEWRPMEDKYDEGWAEGYETATLTIRVGKADFTQNYRYRCSVWDADYTWLCTNEVKVVKDEASFVIVTQPTDKYAEVGEEVCFFVEVEGGQAPYTYQWQKMDKFDADWKNKSGATNASLYITVDEEEFEYEPIYRCIITDATGKQLISNFVYVIEREPLVFTKQPEDVYCWVGCQVTFDTEVSGGVAPYTYHWEYTYDGIQIWFKKDYDEPFFNVTLEDEDVFNLNFRYRCVVTDAEGTQVASEEARVIKYTAPYIIYQPKNIVCSSGSSAALTFVVNGTEPLTYQWQKMDKFDEDWKNINPSSTIYRDSQTPVMIVLVTDEEFEYEPVYRCIATDALGNQLISNIVWIVDKDAVG